MEKFADIHCHPTLHPFANKLAGRKKNRSVWDCDPPKERQRDSNYPEFTQSDFTTLARGKVKFIYASLYPVEQGWFDAGVLGEGLVTDLIAKLITRFPVKFINIVQNDTYTYFENLKKEYHFLLADHEKDHTIEGEKYRYKLMKNGAELDNLPDSTIGVVITVEGVQSFISGNEKHITRGQVDQHIVIANIEHVKNTWEFPPFIVTFAHHFYNGFCGHARSLPTPASLLLKQSVGLNEPLNRKGEEIIDCLLGINNYSHHTRRILIDTKHMSVAARMSYHTKIKAYNNTVDETKKVPIVASHSGYSGKIAMNELPVRPDTDDMKYKDSAEFNDWSINLAEDEILDIVESGGLIGLNFDERIVSGYDVIEAYDNEFRRKDIKRNTEEVKEYWTSQLIKNILGIAGTVNRNYTGEKQKMKIWDMIALGTDFDGMINPVDAFITATEFGSFRQKFIELLPRHPDYDALSCNLTPEQIAVKLMFDNALNFTRKYYV